MTAEGMLQIALSALGGTMVAIGWWIGTSLITINEKMERVLVQLEKHDIKIHFLDRKGCFNNDQ